MRTHADHARVITALERTHARTHAPTHAHVHMHHRGIVAGMYPRPTHAGTYSCRTHARTHALRAHACTRTIARHDRTARSHARMHAARARTHSFTHARTHARTHVRTHATHRTHAACKREGGGAGAARQQRCGPGVWCWIVWCAAVVCCARASFRVAVGSVCGMADVCREWCQATIEAVGGNFCAARGRRRGNVICDGSCGVCRPSVCTARVAVHCCMLWG